MKLATNYCKRNKNILILLTVYFFVLFAQALILPIANDGYLYLSLGKNLAEAYRGNVCFSCIDTAHTPFVPFIISIFYYFFHFDNIFIFRGIAILFSLGTVFLIYNIFLDVFGTKRHAFWATSGLSFIPGFFLYSNYMIPDVFALFFLTLFFYFLLKKKNDWKIGIVLTAVLLAKDYMFVFAGIVVLAVCIFETIFEKHGGVFSKLQNLLSRIFKIFILPFVFVILFLFFSFLPYPRILDNLMLEIFGNFYLALGSFLRGSNFAGFFNLSGSELGNIVIKNNYDIVPINEYFKYAIVSENNVFLENSPVFLRMYWYGFKEIFVNLFILPLAIAGFFLRLYEIIKHKDINYVNTRKDILMGSLLITMIYFQYRTINTGDHGFRTMLPIIIPILYFSYFFFLKILEKKKNVYLLIFSILTIINLIMYLYIDSKVFIVTENNGLVFNNILIQNRMMLNLSFYFFIFLIFLFYIKGILRIDRKVILSGIILILVFKLLPNIMINLENSIKNGSDYNLKYAKIYLGEIDKKQEKTLTNMKSKLYYYYADSLRIKNIGNGEVFPVLRAKPKEMFFHNFITYDLSDLLKINSALCDNDLKYIFYVNWNNEKREKALKNIEFLKEQKNIKLIKEFHNKRGELSWILLQLDGYCNK